VSASQHASGAVAPSSFAVFEVSWEVANKVGGIHTVLSTKAKTMVERLGDDYVVLGPWLLAGGGHERVFEEEAGFEGFAEGCRGAGVPVRVGRWRIPGRPRAILVGFSEQFARKDALLAGLWERHAVDSLFGAWDYLEPVMFGHAAGVVIERWWREFKAPYRGAAVAQFHEWLTGAGLLHLKTAVPAIGTVFTTHATILGRSLAATGKPPVEALAGRAPEAVAAEMGVRAKHSMESACAREADVFTTVSDVTAAEAEALHGRRADPLLPNGMDLGVADELAAGVERAEADRRLRRLARLVLGPVAADARLMALSGRYEFHNKGIDLLLDALAAVDARPGRPVVVFLLVPAGNSGVRRELLDRLQAESAGATGAPASGAGPIGITTHNLIDEDGDPIRRRCAKLGLANAPGARVKIVHVPIYLDGEDPLVGMSYEAALRAFDLTLFPSFYEPWGYTPEESLVAGVPTVTSDCAGFGLWVEARGLGAADGVEVLARRGRDDAAAAADLAALVGAHLARERDVRREAEACRRTARLVAWSDLVAHYWAAFESALAAAATRSPARGEPLPPQRPERALPAAPASSVPRLHALEVSTVLPPALKSLHALSWNLAWSWDPDAAQIFEEISPRKWAASGHNPVAFLRQVYPEDVAQRAADPAFVARADAALARFDRYLRGSRVEWVLGDGNAISRQRPVAYLCAEFGVHESLPIYSGGLGVLAGDHLKSASDLDLPLVAVGLFYRRGYVRQRLSLACEQINLEAENDPHRLPLALVKDAAGAPLEVRLELPSSSLRLRAWRVDVGRVPLYLLDADVEGNRAEDRAITHQLYGGDSELRLRQEIVLGRGGVRLLAALGIEPAAWHLNEGHAAFAVLERVAALERERALTFDEARAVVRGTTAFTTHTPVPAGHDRFGEDLMRRYFADVSSWAGLTWERFFALGQDPADAAEFNLTWLALGFAGWVNGVSKLHAEVSRGLTRSHWPQLLEGEVPIRSVTNGVHLASWTAPELARLLAGDGREPRPVRGADFASARLLSAEDLWDVRQRARRALLADVRVRLERAFLERGDSPRMLERMLDGLDERALLIGFARRFAPYKRASLLFADEKRLAAILAGEGRPVRVLFAGKAHPRDRLGQEIVRKVAEMARTEPFLGKVYFLEDYDAALAKRLVQGADVWLNNPVRLMEASGTSGMKAAANGALNLSIPDGWWPEVVEPQAGWTIGEGRTFEDQALQDELDSGQLYQMLEAEVVPAFFQRDERGVPVGWLARVRAALAGIPPTFDSERMVAEYRDQAYAPLARNGYALAADGYREARAMVERHARIRRGFAGLAIRAARTNHADALRVSDPIEIQLEVDLGDLRPDDVLGELVLGHRRADGGITQPQIIALKPVHAAGSTYTFVGSHQVRRSGSLAYGLRVRARPQGALDVGLADLVLWA
jgi:phosphorylase/glycogen(starch) synthase